MVGPRVEYSFSYIRELNLHRSKEALDREFAKLEESTSEFREFVHRFHKDILKYLTKYAGVRSVEAPEVLYVVLRDRGLSYPQPMTVVADENQKLMLVRYVYLVALSAFEQPEAASCLAKWVAKKLPLNMERELRELEQELNIIVALPYDLEEKPLKKWLADKN